MPGALPSLVPAVREVEGEEARRLVPALSDLLRDCVEGGASVSFMWPMAEGEPEAFWRNVAGEVGQSNRRLFVAEEADGALLGSVQLVHAPQPNQPHRADVAKMLVRQSARRRGIGAALLRAAEAAALAAGRTVLVLDTVTGSAGHRLYESLGWQVAGEFPDYALWPRGGLCPTTFMYKRLGQPGQERNRE